MEAVERGEAINRGGRESSVHYGFEFAALGPSGAPMLIGPWRVVKWQLKIGAPPQGGKKMLCLRYRVTAFTVDGFWEAEFFSSLPVDHAGWGLGWKKAADLWQDTAIVLGLGVLQTSDWECRRCLLCDKRFKSLRYFREDFDGFWLSVPVTVFLPNGPFYGREGNGK